MNSLCFNTLVACTMKSFALLTASALLGGASAEVHRLKLNKVPLSEQLVSQYLFQGYGGTVR